MNAQRLTQRATPRLELVLGPSAIHLHLADIKIRRIKRGMRGAVLLYLQLMRHCAINTLGIPVDRPVKMQMQRLDVVDIRTRMDIADRWYRWSGHRRRRRRRPIHSRNRCAQSTKGAKCTQSRQAQSSRPDPVHPLGGKKRTSRGGGGGVS